jgi:uncharacterized protein (DUF488 family)
MNPIIYTIGHSNQNTGSFLNLLKDNGIQVLADIRSTPRSKYVIQFDSDSLKKSVTAAGIKYLYCGREIGGRPDDPTFYDSEGYVLYYLVAKSPRFLKTIERLIEGTKKYKVAIMCSEEDPTECHRRLLVGRVLTERGIEVLHIRSDGRVQSEKELADSLISEKKRLQPNLFVLKKEEPWKSVKPILLDSRKNPQKDSLEP